jgi:hypothetical protein
LEGTSPCKILQNRQASSAMVVHFLTRGSGSLA